LWRYLAEREDGEDPDAPLFTGRYDRPLNKNALRLLITRLGEKAKVKKCHPHRFRHTFAITYLRAGGDLFTLQALLGHSSLEMVQYYARIAEIDVQQAHRRASPADNWRL
jgi:integrase/recombinase XerD